MHRSNKIISCKHFALHLKKLVAFILITLFAANVSGATLSYHFCGKMLQYLAVDLQKQKGKCCCGNNSKKEKSCCKTKHCKVVVDESRSFAKHLELSNQVTGDALVPVRIAIITQAVPPVHSAYIVPPAHAPPLSRPVPLHILYQQFLI